MRCNWLTLARNPFRSFVHPPVSPGGKSPPNALFSGISSLARWPHPTRALPRPRAPGISRFSTAIELSVPPPVPAAVELSVSSPVPTPFPSTYPSSTALPTWMLNASLTQAQMARAAAHAVRLSLKKGALEDAYYVVNSLQYTYLRTRPALLKNVDPASLAKFELAAARFNCEVSPRLASHVLLHELLRAGLTTKARSLAKSLMECNIAIRRRTLHAVMQSVYRTPVAPSQTLPLNYLFKEPRSIHLSPSLSQDPTTSFAIELLTLAHKSRSGRTDAMFNTLITLCIVNGEIIVASLLIGLIIKTFPSRQVTSPNPNDLQDNPVAQEQVQEKLAAARKVYWRNVSDWIRPMYPVIDAINNTLKQDGQGEEFEHSIRSALQALANIAGLLDTQQIPSWSIAPLLHAIYSCPKVQYDVWVLDEKGKPFETNGYTYLHGVLKRLIFSLPTHPPRPSAMLYRNGARLLPPLDIHGYNALLHYALRHRLSPAWANHILEHISTQRFKPLQPDVTTLNILLRSGTLLRRSDISDVALKLLKLGEASVKRKPVFKPKKAAVRGSSRFSKGLKRLESEAFDSLALEKAVTSAIKGDSYSLTAFINHLAASGNPREIENLVFRILPGLRHADIPADDDLSPTERIRTRAAHRHQALKRTVKLGPYVLTALLNALCKAGKTGLAEWVWLWAKTAESMSLRQTDVDPWCLPIHAYTIMIKCYGQEAMRGCFYRANSKMDQGEALNPHAYVIGYGRFLEKRDRLKRRQMKRGTLGRHLGVLVYRSMQSAAHVIYGSCIETRNSGLETSRTVPIPKPDPRFFNAFLDILRHGASPRRAQKYVKDRCRYRMHRANEFYGRYGVTPGRWSEELQRVGEDIVDAGYEIPIGIRHLFVGHWSGKTFGSNTSCVLNRRPFSYNNPPKAVLNGHLYTYKTKGLPLARGDVRRLCIRRHRRPRRPRS